MSFVVPDACTLPTVEQPVRLAEFDELFATAVREVDQVDPTHARLRLTGPAGLAAAVRDLTARETECCSFFVFTVAAEPSETGEAVALDIKVPQPYAQVLASLTGRAREASAERRHEDRVQEASRGSSAAGLSREQLRARPPADDVTLVEAAS